MTLISVTNDLYDIACRLKTVDDDYRLFYNTGKRRYEVYSKSRETLQFVVPFDELDARTVDYALKTRVQNADSIFAEVERHNKDVQRRLERRATNTVIDAVKEYR